MENRPILELLCSFMMSISDVSLLLILSLFGVWAPRLPLSPHTEKVPGLNPHGAFLCGVCRFSPCLREFSTHWFVRVNNQISEQQNINGTLKVTSIVLDFH